MRCLVLRSAVGYSLVIRASVSG